MFADLSIVHVSATAWELMRTSGNYSEQSNIHYNVLSMSINSSLLAFSRLIKLCLISSCNAKNRCMCMHGVCFVHTHMIISTFET